MTIAVASAILLLAAMLLVLGVTNVERGIRGIGESPRNYLTFGLFAIWVGLLLAAAGTTIAFAEKRRRKL